jgi:hypothetical protein
MVAFDSPDNIIPEINIRFFIVGNMDEEGTAVPSAIGLP